MVNIILLPLIRLIYYRLLIIDLIALNSVLRYVVLLKKSLFVRASKTCKNKKLDEIKIKRYRDVQYDF